MIDQIKIGRFLRELRKEKGNTQEEIANLYGISSRSVSRWENGNNMPDLALLVELADYYQVDIKEIIDGERKSEKMNMETKETTNENETEDIRTNGSETKETLLKIADYADHQKRRAILRAIIFFALEMVCCGMSIGAAIVVINGDGQISAGYAVIPMIITFILSVLLVLNAKDYTTYIRKSNSENRD